MANRFPLWGQAGWASAEVVGETHYAKAIRALFGGDFDPRGTDMTLPVQLIPDRNNRHDRNAVGVWSGSSLLGHLPRAEAARYVGVLSDLTARGLVPEVNARITGREWGAADGRPAAFDSTIRLDLAEPHMIVPANAAPVQEHRLLPSGSAVQVVGQQQNLDTLVPLLRPEGECWAYVTLHEMADHLVEVRIGDARVGDLSPKMSGELLPALRHMAEQGLVTAARAIVRGNSGNSGKSEVMLYVARVQDLPESWQGPAQRPAAGGAPGRGTASVPSPGVAATGPVTPGPVVPGGAPGVPAPAVPTSGAPFSGGPGSGGALPGGPGSAGVMSGGPASGGLVPNWVSGDALPSWAAPASTNPAVTPAPATTPLPPSAPVPPATSVPPGAGGSSSFPSTFASSLGAPAQQSFDQFPGQSAAGAFSAGSGAFATGSGSGQSAAGAFSAGSGAFATGSGSGPGRAAAGGGPGQSGLDAAVPGWAAADGRLGWSTGDTTPAWAGPSENPPTLAAAGENPPSWAATGDDAPNRAGTGGVPSWSAASGGVPNVPSAGSLAATGSGRHAASGTATTPVPQIEGPGGLATDPLNRSAGPAGPVSPAPGVGNDHAIAETTVIPALAAVVKANSGALAGLNPVSGAPDAANPHPPIPPAPTGIRFVVPAGWPTPPSGWYPPDGWRPDPAWPPAPADWQFWVPSWD